jgi:hypothetical protein
MVAKQRAGSVDLGRQARLNPSPLGEGQSVDIQAKKLLSVPSRDSEALFCLFVQVYPFEMDKPVLLGLYFDIEERSEMSEISKKLTKVTHVTPGFLTLSEEQQLQAISEFESMKFEREDWFYSVLEGQVFIVDHGEGGFTAMLSEEY